MRISEAAEAAGVNVETVRYYERRGLLEQPPRPVAGYRQYPDEAVRIVRFVKHAQDLGFTLGDVEELLHLPADTRRGRERAREVAERKLGEVEQKMQQLREMQATLRRLIESCRSNEASDCPILEAISDTGPARYQTRSRT